MSDIVFGTFDQIEVTCSNLNVHGSDLTLDSPARRKPGGPRFRRALVHDESDGLTINFNTDYPGGVSVAGALVVRGGLSFEMVEKGKSGTALPPTPEIPFPHFPEVIFRTQVDLQEVLLGLRGEIADLKARVAKLEARP
jgi:hypothetical protein